MVMTHLHLGCGDVRLPPPWTNVDCRWGPAVDRRDNIGILQHVPANSITEIYAAHCLDHFDRWTYKTVLARWFALLKPGGVLRISTPDFEATVEQYRITGNLSELTGQLYAGQDYADNVRHWIWDMRMASDDLIAVGFETPKRYDAEEFFDSLRPAAGRFIMDCSLFEFVENKVQTLRSLNITARKP